MRYDTRMFFFGLFETNLKSISRNSKKGALRGEGRLSELENFMFLMKNSRQINSIFLSPGKSSYPEQCAYFQQLAYRSKKKFDFFFLVPVSASLQIVLCVRMGAPRSLSSEVIYPSSVTYSAVYTFIVTPTALK